MKSLSDGIVTFIIYNILLQLQRFRYLPLTLTSSSTRRHLKYFRKIAETISPFAIARELKLWKQSHKKMRKRDTIISEIKDHTCDIPRLNDVLSKWDISSYNENSSDDLEKISEFITVSIISSSNYIQPETQEPKSKTEHKNKLSVSTLKKKLGNLPSSVQIILDFWGGGMSTKIDMGKGIKVTRLLCEANKKMERYTNLQF